MTLKREIVREIRALEEEIKLLEIKRSRSQASLIDALVSKIEPREEDVNFFRVYTEEINTKRDRLQRLSRELEKLA